MTAQELIDTAVSLLDNRQGMPNTPEPRLREADVRARLAQAAATQEVAKALTRLAEQTR